MKRRTSHLSSITQKADNASIFPFLILPSKDDIILSIFPWFVISSFNASIKLSIFLVSLFSFSAPCSSARSDILFRVSPESIKSQLLCYSSESILRTSIINPFIQNFFPLLHWGIILKNCLQNTLYAGRIKQISHFACMCIHLHHFAYILHSFAFTCIHLHSFIFICIKFINSPSG